MKLQSSVLLDKVEIANGLFKRMYLGEFICIDGSTYVIKNIFNHPFHDSASIVYVVDSVFMIY